MSKKSSQVREMIDADAILDKIVALTFTRHAKLSEEDFLKEIKAQEGDSEEIAILKSKFALISACTRELLRANDTLRMLNATLNISFGDNKNDK